MLAYAPRPVSRAGSPRTLLFVIAGHALALALVLTVRSHYIATAPPDPTDVIFIEPIKPPPPPPAPSPTPPRDPVRSTIDRPPPIIPSPTPSADAVDSGPPVTGIDPAIGTAITPQPLPIRDLPTPVIVRTAARFTTPADEVRPPYPASKQRLGEEASLLLTLSIDPRGRVVAVDQVGRADAAFLDAARRHILRHWRYQPATDGGQAVASRITITLRFELER